jgi:hypothetical protein
MRPFGSAGILAVLLLVGCSVPAPAPEDTGARKAVTDFFEPLITQDWQRGFAVLVPDKKKNQTLEQFKAQALAYRKRIGFDPELVHIRSCEEHNTDATAHLSLIGHVLGQRRMFRESVRLQRRGSDWFVVPPNHFGARTR